MQYKITLNSSSKTSLYLYLKYIKLITKKLKINLVSIAQPTTIKKVTLLKSPHVNKKAKESFEIRNYKFVIYFSSEKAMNSLLLSTELQSLLVSNRPKSVKLKFNFGS